MHITHNGYNSCYNFKTKINASLCMLCWNVWEKPPTSRYISSMRSYVSIVAFFCVLLAINGNHRPIKRMLRLNRSRPTFGAGSLELSAYHTMVDARWSSHLSRLLLSFHPVAQLIPSTKLIPNQHGPHTTFVYILINSSWGVFVLML